MSDAKNAVRMIIATLESEVEHLSRDEYLEVLESLETEIENRVDCAREEVEKD